jgi:hypothetical protein
MNQWLISTYNFVIVGQYYKHTGRFTMKKLVASSPNAEVVGQAVLTLLENINYEQIEPILKKYKLDQIDPERWYPAQTLFNIYREVAEGDNGDENLMAIGVKAAETAVLPPEVTTLEAFLQLIDPAYRMNFRNISDDDSYKVLAMEPGYARVANNTPTPDHAAYGILWGFARMLTGRNSDFRVTALSNTNELSDEATVFEITWRP